MIDGVWLLLRAAGLILPLQAVGTALFTAAYGGQLVRSVRAVHAFGAHAVLWAIGVLAAQLLFEPAHLAGEWAGIVDPGLLRLFLASSAAAALALRLAGIVCIALALRGARARRLLAALGALLTVGSFLLVGHTAVDARRLLLSALLLLHVGVAAFWFGSLWPLRRLTGLEVPADAARVLDGFSALAVWLAPLIAVAGIAMALVLLPNLAALAEPYGLLLLTKLALFAVLMALAALNRLRLTPALARAETQAAARLRRSITLEYVLICAVLAVTALMTGSFSPGERA
jgi:copper resistance protein D